MGNFSPKPNNIWISNSEVRKAKSPTADDIPQLEKCAVAAGVPSSSRRSDQCDTDDREKNQKDVFI